MSGQINTGKWRRAEVPKLGWSSLHTEDLRERTPQTPLTICQMCEVRHVRYLHVMTHAAWPEPLRVGQECAARMEGVPPAAVREREVALRARRKRLARWCRQGWFEEQTTEGETMICKDQWPWRIRLSPTATGQTLITVLHLQTGEVLISRETSGNVTAAMEEAWDLWHAAERLRTNYLERLAEEQRERRAREEAEREERAQAQEEEWRRTHPDWDASQEAWWDWLDWCERDEQLARDHKQALAPWAETRNGNLKFEAQGYLFVAKPPEDEFASCWALSVKLPGAQQWRSLRSFNRFEALQQAVAGMFSGAQERAELAHFPGSTAVERAARREPFVTESCLEC